MPWGFGINIEDFEARNMKIAFVTGILLFWATASMANILSYPEWKRLKVNEAKVMYRQLLQVKHKNPKLDAKMKKARGSITMAAELGPNDYFELYLSRNFSNNFKALQAAAGKMSSSEMAEILMAYSSKLNKETESPPTPANVRWLNLRD